MEKTGVHCKFWRELDCGENCHWRDERRRMWGACTCSGVEKQCNNNQYVEKEKDKNGKF